MDAIDSLRTASLQSHEVCTPRGHHQHSVVITTPTPPAAGFGHAQHPLLNSSGSNNIGNNVVVVGGRTVAIANPRVRSSDPNVPSLIRSIRVTALDVDDHPSSNNESITTPRRHAPPPPITPIIHAGDTVALQFDHQGNPSSETAGDEETFSQQQAPKFAKVLSPRSTNNSTHDDQVRFKVGQRLQRRGDGLVSTHVLLDAASPLIVDHNDISQDEISSSTTSVVPHHTLLNTNGGYILKLIRFDALHPHCVNSPKSAAIETAVEADFRSMTRVGSRNIEHVVTVQNLAPHRLAVVTKRINGIPVSEWRPATEVDVTILVRDICKALRYCATHGIRHRHLSASNVYVVFPEDDNETTLNASSTTPQHPAGAGSTSPGAPQELLDTTQESTITAAAASSPPARVPSALSSETNVRHQQRPSQFVVTGFGLGALFTTMSASQMWDMGYRDVAAFPPELILNGVEGAGSNEHMDLWAIGCLAYEALFHCHLYENDASDGIPLRKEELFDIISSRDPVPFPWSSGVLATQASSRGSVSSASDLENSRRPPDPALVAIIRKLLSKDPAQRGTIDSWLKQLSRSSSVSSSISRNSVLSPLRIPSFRRQETEDVLLTTTSLGTVTLPDGASRSAFAMSTSPSSALVPPARRLRNSVSIAAGYEMMSPIQTDAGTTTAATTHNSSITTPFRNPPSRQLSLGGMLDATTIVISSFARGTTGDGSSNGSGAQDSLQSSHRQEPLQPSGLYHLQSFSIPYQNSASLSLGGGAPRGAAFACALCQREAFDGSAMLCKTCVEDTSGATMYCVCRTCYDTKHGSGTEWQHPAEHVFDLHVVDDVSMPSFVNPLTPWTLNTNSGLNDFTVAAASFYQQSHTDSSLGSLTAVQRQNTGRSSSTVAQHVPRNVPRPPMYPSTHPLHRGASSLKHTSQPTALDVTSSPDQQPRSNETTSSITPPPSPSSLNINVSGSGAAAVRRIIPARLLSKREQSILEMGGSLALSCIGTGLLDAERRHLTKAPRRLSLHVPVNVSHEDLGAQADIPQMATSTTTPTRSRVVGLAESTSSARDYSSTFNATMNPEEVSAATAALSAVGFHHSHSATSLNNSQMIPKNLFQSNKAAGIASNNFVEEDRPLTVDELIEECAVSDSSALLLNDMSMTVFPDAVLHPTPMVHITILDLANNLLTDIPDSIEFLVNLRRLLLGNNKLTVLPEAIGNLTDLEHLDVNHNSLTTLPQSLMFCDQMEVLALDYNAFIEIPAVIFDIPSLKMLYLLEVPLTAWPPLDVLQNAVVEGNLTIGVDNIPSLLQTLPHCIRQQPQHYDSSVPHHGLIFAVWNKRFPDFVVPGVFVGSVRSAQSLDVYAKLGITHVLTMGRGLDALPPPGGKHKVVIVDDLPGACIDFAFEDAVAFIDDAVKSGGAVVVHCFAGMSRSATTVIAYLMMKQGMRLDDAYNTTKRGRPAIYPNSGFFDQLLKLDAKLYPGERALDIPSMEREKVP
ncbi:dual specificity protein phosphatase, putative [Bodo saltans]|uniref:protein-tyrosine-phosphatase n=1 Tax=Bodo saltans TaxID=75058 RepID=A0A0S4J7T8_BODSA|nr:dual specificity protein phosphatase, putative [Bodo saltans]|eukprot:CUG86233.1 dual specificity protein phosphatase, putative [Bodo saltans]